jgi:beta-lactam-binding protein with PASTA domain
MTRALLALFLFALGVHPAAAQPRPDAGRVTGGEIAMPSLQGLSVVDARNRLIRSTKAELIVANGAQAATLGASGLVVEQQPLAGQLTVPGRSASVRVGARVPPLIGKTVADATQLVKPLLLRLAPDPAGAAPGDVIATQSPPPGTLAPPDTVIQVRITANKMPNLIGQSETTARQSLEQAHISAALSIENANDAAKLGKAAVIVGQDPRAGEPAPVKGGVRVQMGALVPDLRGRPFAVAQAEAARLLFVVDPPPGGPSTEAASTSVGQEPAPGTLEPPGKHIQLTYRATVNPGAGDSSIASSTSSPEASPEPSVPSGGGTNATPHRGPSPSHGWLWLLLVPVVVVVGLLIHAAVRRPPKPVVTSDVSIGEGVFSVPQGQRAVKCAVRTTVAFNPQTYGIVWLEPEGHVRVRRIDG